MNKDLYTHLYDVVTNEMTEYLARNQLPTNPHTKLEFLSSHVWTGIGNNSPAQSILESVVIDMMAKLKAEIVTSPS